MRLSRWVIAYHGCDKSIGEKILAGEADVVVSENKYDWLGSGAYFWEDSYSRALKWAEFLHENPRYAQKPIHKPFVVGAILNPGNCLDLTDAECLNLLKAAAKGFRDISDILDTPIPENEEGFTGDEDLVKRKLDYAVINFLHELRREAGREAFDTVRSPFFEGGPLFEGARIASRTHVQWCVRQPRDHIFAYFRPRAISRDAL